MRKLEIKNRTVFEVDFDIANIDNVIAFGMAIWCSIHLTKKLELDFENGIAQCMVEDDALKFEKEYG